MKNWFGMLKLCVQLLTKALQMEAFVPSAVFILDQSLCYQVEKSTGENFTHLKKNYLVNLK